MITAVCVITLIALTAATWFLGLWNNVITLINLILAGLIASNFFEPLADSLESRFDTYTYLLDFVSLWGLFFVSFAALRTATDILSRYRLEFNAWVEMIGRSVTSISIAWIFLCFMLFSLHTAPLPPLGDFQPSPDATNFVGDPDRLWLAFLQSRSRGALAESLQASLLPEYDTGSLHPDDRELGVRVFDSKSDFVFKYQQRRNVLVGESGLRVNRR